MKQIRVFAFHLFGADFFTPFVGFAYYVVRFSVLYRELMGAIWESIL
jgi:hypothetical protein